VTGAPAPAPQFEMRCSVWLTALVVVLGHAAVIALLQQVASGASQPVRVPATVRVAVPVKWGAPHAGPKHPSHKPLPVVRQALPRVAAAAHPRPTMPPSEVTLAPAPPADTGGALSERAMHAAPDMAIRTVPALAPDIRPAQPPAAMPAAAGSGAALPSAAHYLHNPAPRYPRIARRNGEQGTVLLRVLVGADGTPQQVMVQSSSGHVALDHAAVRAVRHWVFYAASRDGTAQPAWVVVPLVFSLKENK